MIINYFKTGFSMISGIGWILEIRDSLRLMRLKNLLGILLVLLFSCDIL